MSDKDNKIDHVNTEKSLNAASATVFHKVRKLAREQLFVVIGIVVLVVILVVSIGIILWQNGTKPTGYNGKDTNLQTDSRAEAEAATKRLDRQVEDARVEELSRLIASEADKQKKSDYCIELALIHFDRAKYDEALPLGLEAENLVKSAVTAGIVGDIYYAKKDYAQAVKQYDVAMSRSEKPANSNERSPYNDYQYLKKKAEASQ